MNISRPLSPIRSITTNISNGDTQFSTDSLQPVDYFKVALDEERPIENFFSSIQDPHDFKEHLHLNYSGAYSSCPPSPSIDTKGSYVLYPSSKPEDIAHIPEYEEKHIYEEIEKVKVISVEIRREIEPTLVSYIPGHIKIINFVSPPKKEYLDALPNSIKNIAIKFEHLDKIDTVHGRDLLIVIPGHNVRENIQAIKAHVCNFKELPPKVTIISNVGNFFLKNDQGWKI